MEFVPGTVLAILVLALVVGIIWARGKEKKDYNRGYCPRCGEHMELFDYDSHGSRGYKCNRCHYYCWISYNVDRDYEKNE